MSIVPVETPTKAYGIGVTTFMGVLARPDEYQ